MLDKFYDALLAAKHAVCFTGAGVSTLSGIKDFRSPDGVYSKPWQGYNVEDILSLSFFRHDPSIFYAWARDFCYCLDRFEPNIVHKTLAELQKRGILKSLITQNIDLLHTRAGSPDVIEVHGSPAKHHCLKCHKVTLYDEIAPIVMRGEVPKCSCGGVIKPDIIFYEEQLVPDDLNRAFDEAQKSDLFIVLGSSLTVQPAASLPLAALQRGAKICIVNAQPTMLDNFCSWKFNDLKEVFESISHKLEQKTDDSSI